MYSFGLVSLNDMWEVLHIFFPWLLLVVISVNFLIQTCFVGCYWATILIAVWTLLFLNTMRNSLVPNMHFNCYSVCSILSSRFYGTISVLRLSCSVRLIVLFVKNCNNKLNYSYLVFSLLVMSCYIFVFLNWPQLLIFP